MVEATKEKRTDWNWSEYEPGTRETVHSPHRARGIGIGRPRLIRGQCRCLRLGVEDHMASSLATGESRPQGLLPALLVFTTALAVHRKSVVITSLSSVVSDAS